MVGSNGNPSRSSPSSQPTYQSGCAGLLTAYGMNGPYSHTGLIWISPAMRAITAAVRKRRPTERKTWPGQNGRPTTLSSRVARLLY